MPFNYHAFRKLLEDAVCHYEKLSPALAGWLDETYVALAERPESVTVSDLMQVQQLRMNGEWEQHNFAQNRLYKLRAMQGKDRGVLSF